MVQNVQELVQDVKELQGFLGQAKSASVKTFLETEINRLNNLVATLEKPKVQEAKGEKLPPKRYISEITTYAWDQSSKFVKIFVTIDGIQAIENPDTNVQADFTERSLKLTISNFKDKDYTFTVNNLLQSIDVQKSYRKVKSDMVAIYLKKTKEQEWSHLTMTAKQLNDMKDSKFKDEAGSDASDPTSSLMTMMKKMYETGTPEMKQTIAKAWQESEEKRRSGMGSEYDLPQ